VSGALIEELRFGAPLINRWYRDLSVAYCGVRQSVSCDPRSLDLKLAVHGHCLHGPEQEPAVHRWAGTDDAKVVTAHEVIVGFSAIAIIRSG